jgi:hypothetical protein
MNLSPAERARYDQLTAYSKQRKLETSEEREFMAFGERYAVQLRREGEEYRARRAKDMEDFFADKKENGSEPGFERDFVKWLELKGRV